MAGIPLFKSGAAVPKCQSAQSVCTSSTAPLITVKSSVRARRNRESPRSKLFVTEPARRRAFEWCATSVQSGPFKVVFFLGWGGSCNKTTAFYLVAKPSYKQHWHIVSCARGQPKEPGFWWGEANAMLVGCLPWLNETSGMWLFDHGVTTDEKGLIKPLRTTRQRGNAEPRGRGQVRRKPQLCSVLQHRLVSMCRTFFSPPLLNHVYLNHANKIKQFCNFKS